MTDDESELIGPQEFRSPSPDIAKVSGIKNFLDSVYTAFRIIIEVQRYSDI